MAGLDRSQPLSVALCAPLQDDEEVSEFALDGLKQVMAIKSRVVLPYLVPKVIPPCSKLPLPQKLQPHDHSQACSGDLLSSDVGGGRWWVQGALEQTLSPEHQLWDLPEPNTAVSTGRHSLS